MNWILIGSSNGLSHMRRPATTKLMMIYIQLNPWEQTSAKIKLDIKIFIKKHWKCRFSDGDNFVTG